MDYGLSKRFRDQITKKHIPYSEKQSFIGTIPFASANTHLGIFQTQRDDLEALGYTLVYFLTGSLPWINIKGHSEQSLFRRVLRSKSKTPLESLCKDLPKPLRIYFEKVKSMRFDEIPNYKNLKDILSDSIEITPLDWDSKYSGRVPEEQKSKNEEEKKQTTVETIETPRNGDLHIDKNLLNDSMDIPEERLELTPIRAFTN